jgi:Cytochrome c554 and c-prime
MIRVGASLLLSLIVWLYHSGQSANQTIASASPAHAGRADYVGDAACASCHGQQSASYIHTSHSLTSRPVNKDSVLASFAEGRNILTIVNPANAAGQPGLYFKMEEKEDGYYQTAVTGFDSQLLTRTERMDVVTGSGARGSTYLYWEGDQLFELPVSYWTDGHQWINSPGYTNGTVDFSRPINPGCLECHASYIQPLSADPMTNHYDRTSLVTGITCERCHGPGAEHIAQQKDGTAGTQGQEILNPTKFPRDRQVDLCALCHNGIQREATAPAFSYVPGQPLSNYFKPLPVSTAEHPDVHGNQVGLLERSRCYLSSPQMSCSTCHDVHAVERPAAAYSERCINCHKWQSCGVSKRLGHAITKNCIDCHMPVEQTNVIVSETGDRIVQASMRNHWIKVYPPSRSKPAVKH